MIDSATTWRHWRSASRLVVLATMALAVVLAGPVASSVTTDGAQVVAPGSAVPTALPALAPQEDAAATAAERDADEVRSFGTVLTGSSTVPTGTTPLTAAATTVSTGSARATAKTAAVAFPSLSSRPGSKRTIFLNFRGASVKGTAWNSGSSAITVRPYDTDGRTGTTTAAEAAVVTEVWRRVVEDYQPFDVNVTTVAPSADALNRTSSSDQTYGVTVIVSNETFYVSSCRCGGIAYTGVFDRVPNDAYNEAWVFTRTVGKGARNIAEAVTHEAGHTLGLDHDGTASAGYYGGQGSWAPVMGDAYSRPVTQFSRGEYRGANNRQDDLSVIRSHGLALRPDEDRNTASTARSLARAKTLGGVISTTTDVDLFKTSLTRGRRTTVSARVAPYGPNLDVALVVRDSRGRVVASANPTTTTKDASTATGLSASLTFTPSASGTYYVEVRGSGSGSASTTGYSSYASVGAYWVSWTS